MGRCLAAAAVLLPLQAAAQARNDAPKTADDSALTKIHYYLSFGPVVLPDYDGSDDYEPSALLIGRIIRGGAYLEWRGSALRAQMIPASLFQAGPVLNWRRSRKDIQDSRVDRMRDVSGALEAGGFFGVMLRDPDALRRRIGVKLEAVQDVSGSHDGYEAKLVLEGGMPLGEAWSFDARLLSRYGSGSYMDTYYSVDADNAARSGLSEFDADAGFRDVSFDLSLNYSFSDRWGMSLIGGYSRYIGDAGDSPVVSTAGSRDTFFAAINATFQY